jgi:hypothetical protein
MPINITATWVPLNISKALFYDLKSGLSQRGTPRPVHQNVPYTTVGVFPHIKQFRALIR